MNILEFMQNISTQVYLRGDVIFREGDPHDGSMYCIMSGMFAVTKRTPDGTQEVIKGLGPGEFFGELSLLTRRPRAMTLSVVSANARVGILRDDQFEKLARINTHFLFQLTKSTVEKLHRAEARLTELDKMLEEIKKEEEK
ncbi:cyclic nucleotide-binding domain protein [Leptospira wolbachii serovar Codice str. CDC]|uniref:Cyclic nucleotide-binding domain protein n=1 Tax=Leptospira wolbachii serovar Codice str. CDC TaxID=1218599 RepID=R9A5J8_9LEPT|nr:cyclic nucleotide-binding domain-containing protein [Leptospira wolbachii]EOQ97476.1 cyclic nucleotide-binding domain protein [Leptospira wolbachii serovar Codice str. CDC]